jgi:hypothetical protein
LRTEKETARRKNRVRKYRLKFVLDTSGKESGKFESEIRIITNTIPDWYVLKITAEIE